MSSNYRHIFVSKDQKICLSLRKLRIIGGILSGSTVIVNAHGTKKFVRINESSNYRVFELTIVDCIYDGLSLGV